MAAKVELCFASKQYIDLNCILVLLNALGQDITSQHIVTYPDWTLPVNAKEKIDESEIELHVTKGRIIFVEGICNKIDFGIQEYSEQDVFFHLLWVDTKFDPSLDADILSDRNASFYDSLTDMLLSKLGNRLIFAALGSEMVVEYSLDFPAMIENSFNVLRWVVPCGREIEHLPGYSEKDEMCNNIIFSKID